MVHHPKAIVGDPVPEILRQWLHAWRTCFTAPSWEHALVLVMGALLAPGKRTVSSCLRMTGRAEAANFATYHQILNRARWSPRAATRRLLGIVVERLVPMGPVVIGTSLSAAGDAGSPRGAYTVTQSAPATAILSKPADCAG